MNKIMRIGSIGITAALITSIVGCSSESNSGSENGNNKASGSDKITLSLMSNNPKTNAAQGQVKAFYEVLEQFRKDHPNVTIKDEGYGSDYGTKIKTLAAANEVPDVFLLEGGLVDQFSKNGVVKPINDILEADTEFYNSFLPGAFSDVTRGEDIYGIPHKLNTTSLVFYNKDLFKQAGIEAFPKTWDEFLLTIEKLKANGIVPISAGNKDKWLIESSLLSTLGDRHTGTDWVNSIQTRQGAKFTDPEFVSTLQKIKDLSDMGAFNTDINSIDNAAQRTSYYNKKAAMFFEGAWAISAVINDAPKDVLAVTDLALIPTVAGGKGKPNAMSGGSSFGYTINPNLTGTKRDIAIELIKTLTGPGYAKIALENNAYPAFNVEDFDKSNIDELNKKYLDLVSTSEFVPVYDMKFDPAISDAVMSGAQELTIGKTAEEIAKKIQSVYEKGK